MHPIVSGDHLAYFPGGVPAGVGFRLQIDGLYADDFHTGAIHAPIEWSL